MATNPYQRFLTWAEQNAHHPKVTKPENMDGSTQWSIAVGVARPVTFSAYGSSQTIDAAAAAIIADLQTVGVEVP